MPAQLHELGVPQDGLEAIVVDSRMNFSADPKREFLQHLDELLQALRACW